MKTIPDFWGELSYEDKQYIHILMREYKLDFGFAANVYKKRYSLEEAQRRQRLKNREKAGRSVDAYDCGKRLSGSFGSGKKR